MKYGLIGEKLGHSYSKVIHERIVDKEYHLIELSLNELDVFLKERNFKGVNVTIPYKNTVMTYLDEIDDSARKIGAVNTIVNDGDKLIGYNTDYHGFLYTLENHNISVKGEKVIVLGNGGASKAVIAVLEDLGAEEISVVARTQRGDSISFEECYKNHTDGKIIINSTPVGMYPKVDASPLNLETFKSCRYLVDLIYNPSETMIMKQARIQGIYTVNGLEMLVAQAKFAAEYFHNIKIDNSIIKKVHEELLN